MSATSQRRGETEAAAALCSFDAERFVAELDLKEPGEAGLAAALACALGRIDRALDAKEEDALLQRLQRLRGRAKRDAFGMVPTPSSVALHLVELAEHLNGDQRAWSVVLDPAVGTGRLLRAAQTMSPGARLIGWDVDASVLAIGAHQLAWATRGGETSPGESPRAAAQHTLQLTNGLRARRPVATSEATLVLCNPPWVNAFSKRSHGAELDLEGVAEAAGAWSAGALSLSVAFVARMVRDVLVPGEIGAFVLPDTLTHGPRYEPFRRALLSLCAEGIVEFHDEGVFSGRTVRTVLLVVRRAELVADGELSLISADTKARSQRDAWRFQIATGSEEEHAEGGSDALTLDRATLAALPWCTFPTPGPGTKRALRAFGAGGPVLGEIVELADGVNTGPREARDALLAASPLGMLRPRRAVEGRLVRAGSCDVANARWLETANERITPAWRKAGTSLRREGLFEGPRIYSRQTTGRLTTCVVDDESFALNSVHVMHLRGVSGAVAVDARTELELISAILNLEATSELYRAAFGERRKTFPQIKLQCLRALPFPWPPPPDLVYDFADGLLPQNSTRFADRIAAWWKKAQG